MVEIERPEGKPRITLMLILLNVIIFLIIFSMPEAMLNAVFETFSLSQAHAIEVWRWFTSLFLHAGPSHLFFNMLTLYFFGKMLEKELDPKWFLSIYFMGGLLGSALFILTSASAVVGASGCVFSIIGAAMLLNPLRRIHLYIFPLPLGIVAMIFVLIETIIVHFQQDFGNIAHVAHLGGLITGTIFAFFSEPKRAAKGTLALVACFALIIIFWPILELITTFGGIALGFMDAVIGFFLYGIASLISPIWL